MDIQTKHRVTLLNAKCNLVNKLYEYCQKSGYGEDICLKGLYAKSKLIDRLDCYQFPVSSVSTTVNGTYTVDANTLVFSFLPGVYYLKSGNTILSTFTITVNTTPSGVISELLKVSGLTFSNAASETGLLYTVIVNCLNSNIKLYYNGALVSPNFNTLLAPVCVTKYTTTYNCLKDTDLPKMYEVLNSLAK